MNEERKFPSIATICENLSCFCTFIPNLLDIFHQLDIIPIHLALGKLRGGDLKLEWSKNRSRGLCPYMGIDLFLLCFAHYHIQTHGIHWWRANIHLNTFSEDRKLINLLEKCSTIIQWLSVVYFWEWIEGPSCHHQILIIYFAS